MSTRLQRLIAIEREIRRGRYPSVERLCDLFSVKRRTIYDDIKILKEGLGLRIHFDRLKNGYYNADPLKQLPTFELTLTEVGLLACALRMFAYFGKDHTLLHSLSDLQRRIGERLPQSASKLYESISRAQCADGQTPIELQGKLLELVKNFELEKE